MKEPTNLFIICAFLMLGAYYMLGYDVVYSISYGTFSIMAAGIAATFFWLWLARSTPLALGMGFGWAGAASVMGWWWVFNLANRPENMQQHPLLFVFLSIYFVGAILHFKLIGRSFGVTPKFTAFIVLIAVSASVSAAILM